MKKDLITHFCFLIAFFIFITLYKNWLSFSYLAFWYGGIIGSVLPDVDYLVYVYLLKPQETDSQRVSGLISNKKYKETWDLLASTRGLRADLIFHSAFFQIIFLTFSFLVITSSGNLLGRGLVLAFLLHILVDQFVDFVETKNLDSWFRKILIIEDNEHRKYYLIANLVVLLALGFFF